MAFRRGLPSTAVQGDLRRNSQRYSTQWNTTASGFSDGVQLRRRHINSHPIDQPTRMFIKDRRREKERVDVNKVQAGRRPLRDDLKITTRTDTWNPSAGAVLIQRVPGKTGRLLDRSQTLHGARRGR